MLGQLNDHDYFDLGSACFGDKACQEQRALDMERQRLELQMLQSGGLPTEGGMSAGALVGIALVVLLLLGAIIYFTVIKPKKG